MTTTPAPWIVGVLKPIFNGQVHNVEHIAVVTANETSKIVALCGVAGAEDETESIANAVLIASSPTMLEALIDLQDKIARQLEASELPDVQLIEWQEIISNAMEKIHAEAS